MNRVFSLDVRKVAAIENANKGPTGETILFTLVHPIRALSTRMIRLIAILLATLTLDAQRAYSAPPPVGSEAAEIMQPYAEWIHDLHNGPTWCCDVSDARPVEVRRHDGHWQVRFITPAELPTPAPVGWQDVPDAAVVRDSDGRPVASPVGLSIAWWMDGRVRCFTIPGGV